MTGSYSAILGGVLAAFLLGYGLGFLLKAARELVKVAANVSD